MFSQPMAVTDHSTWRWICLNIQPKVRTMSAVTSAATTRNVLAVWVCSYFFDSCLTLGSDQRNKLTWGANFHEYFWARHLSAQISRPLMANEEVVALTRSVRAKWGNYAFESVHFMFHYPPPPAQQYPPAFLHLVTRKLNFICWASDARHIGRHAAWWSVYPRDDHITHHMLYPISVTSVTLWPLHAATGLRALKVAWSMPPTMLLMSDIRQNIGATKIEHLTSRRRRNASHDCKTYERHKNVINV